MTTVTDVELAGIVRHVLRPPSTLPASAMADAMFPGLDARSRTDFVKTFYPSAAARFGMGGLMAAAKTTRGCRWCLARAFATAYREQPLTYSRAGRALLGEACPRCVTRMRERVRALRAMIQRRQRFQREYAIARRQVGHGSQVAAGSRDPSSPARSRVSVLAARSPSRQRDPSGVSAYYAEVARQSAEAERRLGLRS